MTYDKNNIFAKILRGEIPCNKIYESKYVLAFYDINPQKKIHALVIPKKLIPRIALSEESDGELLGHLLLTARRVAKENSLDEGFRIIINNGKQGGESVPHLHVHLMGGRKLNWPPG